MTTNTKIVRDKVQEHIKEFYTMEELKENIKHYLQPRNYGTFISTPTIYIAISDLVDDGFFLVYTSDVVEFLNSLGINPTNKQYDTQKSWNLYKHLIARECEKMLVKGVNL